jgi:hypothetical protein
MKSLIYVAIAASFCASAAKAGGTADTVNALMAAYNAHDVAAMRALWADDIVWFDIDGDRMTASVRGAAEFETGMQSYFRSFPDVRSTLSGALESGPYLTGVETATWTSGRGMQSQSAPVVYEVREGKIKRVWYYPATKGH